MLPATAGEEENFLHLVYSIFALQWTLDGLVGCFLSSRVLHSDTHLKRVSNRMQLIYVRVREGEKQEVVH